MACLDASRFQSCLQYLTMRYAPGARRNGDGDVLLDVVAHLIATRIFPLSGLVTSTAYETESRGTGFLRGEGREKQQAEQKGQAPAP